MLSDDRLSGWWRVKIHPVFIYTIASVVIGLWIANFIAGLVVEGYNPDPTIGGAVMLVLGLVLAAGIRGNGGGGGDGGRGHRQEDEASDGS